MTATIDEAVFDLESMGGEFLLFTEEASGQDAVLHRTREDVYRLRYLAGPGSAAVPVAAVEVEVDERPAPVLTGPEARTQLEGSDESWVFFRDSAGGRGRVVYRRNDGHDGLIEPVEPPTTVGRVPSD